MTFVATATATARRRNTKYQHGTRATYGNVAYDLAYADSAVVRGGAEVLRPQPKVRQRERAAVRPKVKVRQAGHVSVFAVVGFLAVGVFACLLLLSYVQLTVAGDQVVSLKRELSQLESEQSRLLAKYELAFDLSSIEQKVTADGSMVKPQSGQMYTLDLSEPDSVVRYENESPAEAAGGVVDQAKSFIDRALAYFR